MIRTAFHLVQLAFVAIALATLAFALRSELRGLRPAPAPARGRRRIVR